MPYHQIIMTTREKLIQEFVANVEVGAEIRISQDCATKLNAAVDYDAANRYRRRRHEHHQAHQILIETTCHIKEK